MVNDDVQLAVQDPDVITAESLDELAITAGMIDGTHIDFDASKNEKLNLLIVWMHGVIKGTFTSYARPAGPVDGTDDFSQRSQSASLWSDEEDVEGQQQSAPFIREF